MPDRLYSTLAELVADLNLEGVKDEEAALSRIRAASSWIDRKIGPLYPITEARRFDGNGQRDLKVEPLLAVINVVDDGATLASTDYLLYPRQRHWPNGPYSRISLDPDSGRSVWTRERDVVVIDGRYGLYEESVATGTTLGAALADGTGVSMQVVNGAKVSPGMVVLIESEQLLVELTEAPIDSTADTTEAIDISEEEIDVNTGSLVKVGEIIRIDFEQFKVLDINGNTLAVARGWNHTKRTTHLTAAQVDVYRKFTVKRGINGTTGITHANSTPISRYLAPHDCNWLCRQMAGLMEKKAQSGFAGKVGNTEMGEVFYQNEFPNDPIEKVRKNYRIVSL